MSSASSPARSMPSSWLPWLREAALVRSCLHTGLNSLIRANHADTGLYNQAFFNLQAGLERMLKLIFIIDHAVENGGAMPTNDVLRKRFGHDLVPLVAHAHEIRARYESNGEEFLWGVGAQHVLSPVVGVLAEFGRTSRYYNLNHLVGATRVDRDPVAAWASDVARPLLEHYPARRGQSDANFADLAEAALGESAAVVRVAENGDAITQISSEILHGRRGEWVQEQATFHVATMVRFLAELLRTLNYKCLRGDDLELPFLWEFFGQYNNDDRDLKGRRTFL